MEYEEMAAKRPKIPRVFVFMRLFWLTKTELLHVVPMIAGVGRAKLPLCPILVAEHRRPTEMGLKEAAVRDPPCMGGAPGASSSDDD